MKNVLPCYDGESIDTKKPPDHLKLIKVSCFIRDPNCSNCFYCGWNYVSHFCGSINLDNDLEGYCHKHKFNIELSAGEYICDDWEDKK